MVDCIRWLPRSSVVALVVALLLSNGKVGLIQSTSLR